MSTDANFPKNAKDVDDYAEAWIEKLALTNQPIPIPEHIYNLSGGVSLPVQMQNKLKSEAPKKPKVSFAPGTINNEEEKERLRQEAEKQFERARDEHIRNVAHAMERAREDEIQQGKFGLKNAIMEILQNRKEEGGNPLPNSLMTKMHYDQLKKNGKDEGTDENKKQKRNKKMPPPKATKKRKATKKKNPFIEDEAEEDNTIIEERPYSPSDPPIHFSSYSETTDTDDDDDDDAINNVTLPQTSPIRATSDHDADDEDDDEIEKCIADKNLVSAHNGKINGK